MHIDIELPLTAEKIANLRAGDTVKLSGVIYTARDAAHKRLVAALDQRQLLLCLIGRQALLLTSNPS